jgi:hypothetical protein
MAGERQDTARARHAMSESAFRSLCEAHRLCELGGKELLTQSGSYPGLSLPYPRQYTNNFYYKHEVIDINRLLKYKYIVSSQAIGKADH